MNISIKTIAWAAAFVGAAALVFVFGLSERAPGAAPHGPQGMMPPPLEVSTASVMKQTIPVFFDYVGTTEAVRSVTLLAKADGHVIEQAVRDGADVKQGDLLYRIDPRDYQAALDQATAQLRKDMAARDYARARSSRTETLAKEGYAARDIQDQNTSMLNQSDATLAADQAAIQTAKLRLAYTEIRAPFSGRLSRSLVHEGTLVSAETTKLNTLVQLDPIRVTFSPSEKDLATIVRSRAAGELPVEVRLSEDASRVYTGTLTFIDNAVDRTTGTIVAQATLSNADLTLIPGQYVHVRLLVDERPNALLVPKIAIGSSQMGKFVYIVGKDGVVEQRFITPSIGIGEFVVVDKGLNEGESVITDNLQKLGPGAPVRPKGS
jgi:membrane fusion protein, multidrug efflux system